MSFLKTRLRFGNPAHSPFLLLLILFAAFRLLTLLLYRPGGFIADFSDYDFYYTWGLLTPMGYRAYENLWTAYPPLFPTIMLSVFEWSSRIPPWVEPRLFFHLLFGSVLLLFECGNFICIYWLGRRLALDEAASHSDPATRALATDILAADNPAASPLAAPGLWPAVLYGFLFVPVYTLTGWFEPMPLFFMLLGLALLLTLKWGWLLSAIAAALGFLTKLTPILLLPIAIRWLGARLSVHAARTQWFRPAAPDNLLRPTLYVALFAAVAVGVGYPLARFNPALAFSSFQVQNIRPPWQSIWALLDGFYGYGLVPLDMRNLQGLSGPLWESNLPWTWIGIGFALLYLYLYTRAYDWQRMRTPLVFAAASVILLFLYSKGWSPQFLTWILVFIVLLIPQPRWILAAILLSLLNFVEANVFLIMLPNETWLMTGTVLFRTALLLLLLAELLAQIWPSSMPEQTADLHFARRLLAGSVWGVLALALILGAAALPRTAAAYQSARLAEHPCRETVFLLKAESAWPAQTLVTQQPELWRDLYPWLRQEYEIVVLDGYDPQEPATEVALASLDARVAGFERWWIMRADLDFPGSSPPDVWERYTQRATTQILEEHILDACTLYRLVDMELDTDHAMPVAKTTTVDDATIQLVAHTWQTDEIGSDLRMVLYWQADGPVQASYTVFVHILDQAGNLIAQQDNVPVAGLAPTTHWTPGVIIRDPYHLPLEANAEPVTARVGLYTEQGRVVFMLADDTTQDFIEIALAAPPQ